MRYEKLVLIATAASLAMVLPGCPQKEGPHERAGKSVDKAVETTGKKIEKAGEDVQDAAKGKK